MANTKTAKKNILINERNRQRNQALKSRMKTFLKKAEAAITENTSDKEAVVREALRIIDKTKTKGVIKRTTASRKKSNLASKLNKAPEAAPKKAAPKQTTTKKKAEPKVESKETEVKAETKTKKAAESKKAAPKKTTAKKKAEPKAESKTVKKAAPKKESKKEDAKSEK